MSTQRKSNKSILDAEQVNLQVMSFIEKMEDMDEPVIASEFILSQLSYMVSNLTKRGQREFFEGMDNCLMETTRGI